MTDLARTLSPFARKYGPWALVTGASDGIGRAFAIALAARGLNVVLVARRQAELAAVAQLLLGPGGGPVQTRVLAMDLAQPGGAHRLTEATADLDIGLVVAAAGFGTSGDFLDASLDDERAMLAVNCDAVLVLVHSFGQRLRERGRGGLVLLSSLLAFQGVPRAAHYAATKAYIQSLAEGLRRELKPHGVDVIASAPGPTASGFARRARMTMSRTVTADTVAVETLRQLGRATTVRPGWLSKVLEASLSPLPRAMRVRVLTMVMAQMTR